MPSGVVIYRDGAPTLAGYFQNEPYFDMDSIDVFRGPQGTFVGKNAAGGAVFINTKDPELGGLQSQCGRRHRQLQRLRSDCLSPTFPLGTLPPCDWTTVTIERDDYYDSITGDFTGHPGEVDNNSYRLGFLWQPSTASRRVLKVDYHDLDFGGNVTTVYGEKPLGDVVQNANFQYTDESLRAVLDIKYQFANGISLTSLTGYQDVDSVNNLDVNATVPLLYIFNSAIDAQIYSEEINLISPSDQRFTWVVGLFWEKQDSKLPPWQEGGFNFIGNGFPPDFPWATSPWDNNEEDRAVFVHTAFRFTQQLQLEAGVRYGEYDKDQFTLWQLGDGATPPSIPWPGTNPAGERQSLSEDSVDWQVALNWDVNDKQYLYGLVSRGHVSGGINIFPPFVQYDEMEVINYETGWKSRWANDQFNTQFTVYYENFKDYQANFAEVVGALNFPTNRNAETDSNLWGVELSGQARFGGLQLDFGVAYSESELGDFSDVQDPFLPPPNNIVNLSGNEIPFAPNFTGNIGLAYDIKLGNLTLTPRVDYSHVDETQAALWDTPMETLPARDLINAQIALEPDSGKWSAVLWSTNLTDEEYIAGIQNNATLYYAAPPGQYGLRFKYNF